MTSDQDLFIEIRFLDSFEVMRRDRLIHPDIWPRKKTSTLLKRLALERRMLKDKANEFLWLESSTAYGTNNLNKSLHQLRQIIDKDLGAGASEPTCRFEDGILGLLPSVWVDALVFE